MGKNGKIRNISWKGYIMNPSFYELDPILQERISENISPIEYEHTIRQMKEGPYQSFMKGVESGRYGRDEYIAMGFIYAKPEECNKDYLALQAEIVSEFSDDIAKNSLLWREAAREEAEKAIDKIPAMASLEGPEREVWINRIVNLQTQSVLYAVAHA